MTCKRVTKGIAVFIMMFAMILSCFSINARAEEASVNKNTAVNVGDGIYFYDMASSTGSSDMILIGSNGRWGLIDTGHRYSKTIKDANGKSYPTNVHGLSCQTAGKNGKDGMKYMIETLGVDHLDFIIGTHAHSDHIGGLPEIAALTVKDSKGKRKSLIDSSTLYFYKTYFNTGTTNDVTWRNPVFYYQAKQAVSNKGGKLIDVSRGLRISNGSKVSVNESGNISTIEKHATISNAKYTPGSATNSLDDNISFKWGNMKITLYNLFGVKGATDDNVNSIVTVIECNGRLICLAGDMNEQFQTEQKISRILQADFLNSNKGYSRFDLVKMSHHGVYQGSNSKEWIDRLQPKLMVGTNTLSNMSAKSSTGAYSSAKYYAIKKYGTAVFGVGASDRMLVFKLTKPSIGIYNMKGSGKNAVLASADSCRDKGYVQNGWSRWAQEIKSADVDQWFYFSNNKAATNKWVKDSHGWLFMNTDGLITKNDAVKGSKGICYVNGDGYANTARNKWQWVSAKKSWYYFNSGGWALTNAWKKDSHGWCYLGKDGKMVKDIMEKDSHGWCYVDKNGYVLTAKNRWQWVGAQKSWYFLNSNGYMVTNAWKKDSKEWCYLGSNGKIMTNTIIKGKIGGKNAWWFVDKDGRRNLRFTGMAKNSNGTWYCQKGVVTFKYNGNITSNGKVYTFKNSKLVSTTAATQPKPAVKLTASAATKTETVKEQSAATTEQVKDTTQQAVKEAAVEEVVANELSSQQITFTDQEYVYDGKEHSIEIEAPEGAVLSYRMSEEEEWVEDIPVFTEPGKYVVYFKSVLEGYADYFGYTTVTITEEKVDVETKEAPSITTE